MKELDSFTVERLEEITELKALSFPPLHAEIAALARIALAAKRAEPWGYEVSGKLFNSLFVAGNYASEMRCDTLALYTTPQLNSPEIPDGWKMLPIAPTDAMQVAAANAIRFDTTAINKLWTGKRVFDAMLAAAPEKPL
ncbi:hypothetical protein [Yersinia kristensenii]|uniref:hypothetical protein n=1 Tax=Yersinia kristensenii TaxID=28152 RepID=UPI00286809CE|nr:hypothetical protein [Yersinia kristensenii]